MTFKIKILACLIFYTIISIEILFHKSTLLSVGFILFYEFFEIDLKMVNLTQITICILPILLIFLYLKNKNYEKLFLLFWLISVLLLLPFIDFTGV
jgi:hypothetical protein